MDVNAYTTPQENDAPERIYRNLSQKYFKKQTILLSIGIKKTFVYIFSISASVFLRT